MGTPLDILKRKTAPFDANNYIAFGKDAQNAYTQGWQPREAINSTQRVYTNPYENALSQVVVPNDNRYGHVALIANNNGAFDVAIRDADGKVIKKTLINVPFSQADNYIKGVVGARIDSINKGDVASVSGNNMGIFKQ
jgi:hypothetical protein